MIRIRMDPHQIERKDPDQHQGNKQDPVPPQFADDKPKYIWNLSLFLKILSLYLEARIRIRTQCES